MSRNRGSGRFNISAEAERSREFLSEPYVDQYDFGGDDIVIECREVLRAEDPYDPYVKTSVFVNLFKNEEKIGVFDFDWKGGIWENVLDDEVAYRTVKESIFSNDDGLDHSIEIAEYLESDRSNVENTSTGTNRYFNNIKSAAAEQFRRKAERLARNFGNISSIVDENSLDGDNGNEINYESDPDFIDSVIGGPHNVRGFIEDNVEKDDVERIVAIYKAAMANGYNTTPARLWRREAAKLGVPIRNLLDEENLDFLLLEASRDGDVELVERLIIEDGLKPKILNYHRNYTALYFLATGRNVGVQEFKNILDLLMLDGNFSYPGERRRFKNQRCSNGNLGQEEESPLERLIDSDDSVEKFKYMVRECLYEIETLDQHGHNLFIRACRFDSVNIAQYLLEEVRDPMTRNPIFDYDQTLDGNMYISSLVIAAEYGSLNVFGFLLEKMREEGKLYQEDVNKALELIIEGTNETSDVRRQNREAVDRLTGEYEKYVAKIQKYETYIERETSVDFEVTTSSEASFNIQGLQRKLSSYEKKLAISENELNFELERLSNYAAIEEKLKEIQRGFEVVGEGVGDDFDDLGYISDSSISSVASSVVEVLDSPRDSARDSGQTVH